MLNILHSLIIPLSVGIPILILLYYSIAIAKGDQIITLERRWFGKQMPESRTVALKNEVGVQARTLGPGFHILIPFIYKIKKHPFITINSNQVGIVTAIAGQPIPSGDFFAMPVDCNLFQDGEAFLKNQGQKGPQVLILPPGQHRINPYLFLVKTVQAVKIEDDEVGIVEAVAGKPCPVGRIFAEPVACDDYQNAVDFFKNSGQKGPQIQILRPGVYRINTDLFRVDVKPVTVIPGGHVGLVTAMDGQKIPDGRLLAKNIQGHSNFEKGEVFINNGGEKGRQIDVLMPGTYRINTMLFNVSDPQPWIKIGPDEIGIVTINEGKPITESSKIAADEVSLDKHSNFQDASAYLEAGGQKGLQISVLRSGNYAINPWFADVQKTPMTEVKIGECAVVTSFVGPEGEDTTQEDVNAKIVENGKKGIWSQPLGPGKHAINTKVCRVDKVPTTQILLNWADSQSSAHKLDSNLKTITLRTSDAFSVNMDVSVIIHIAMSDAPKVVANLGSVDNMIAQVLEPAISSHFRNAAQSVQALDLYTKRAELQQKAKDHIQMVLKTHHIESKDTMIADVVLPLELTKTVSDRQIAKQEQETFQTQKQAQIERRELENATAQANMQKDVVHSERNVEIAENLAKSSVKKAEGEATTLELNAKGKAKAVELAAEAESKSIKLIASAEAEKIGKVGKAEAEIILEKGKSTGEAYKLQAQAMGEGVFGQMKIVEQIAQHNIKLIPDNLIIGNGSNGNGSNIESMLGILALEKLSGKKLDTKD